MAEAFRGSKSKSAEFSLPDSASKWSLILNSDSDNLGIFLSAAGGPENWSEKVFLSYISLSLQRLHFLALRFSGTLPHLNLPRYGLPDVAAVRVRTPLPQTV